MTSFIIFIQKIDFYIFKIENESYKKDGKSSFRIVRTYWQVTTEKPINQDKIGFD